MDILKDGAMVAYLDRFDQIRSGAGESPHERFKEIYDQSFGRPSFAIPLLLLFIAALSAVSLIVLTALTTVGYIKETPLFNLPTSAIGALSGAYMWVANDFIARARRRDFSSFDVYWAVLRFVIAIPIGYAFKSIAADAVGPFIAFSLGAFPLDTLTSALRRITNKYLQLEGASHEETRDDIVKLSGVNLQVVERLANEDLTSISQVAYCDPVRIAIRSNLSFVFITDCMNQALAWMYFQEKLDNLRPLGLRGALEIKNYVDALDTDPSTGLVDSVAIAEHERAVAALPAIATAVGQGPETLQITLREIADDPYTIFLAAIWE